MRDFEGKIADAQAKAAAFQQGLESAGGTVSSDDGAVTVTVAPNGALTDVRLTAEAMRKSHDRLSAEIVAVARKAQRAAAVQVAETFKSVGGAGSETFRMMTEYLPAEEDDDAARDQHQYTFGREADAAREEPVRPPASRRPVSRDDHEDDGDRSDMSVLKDRS
jgi:DNA-binding protein YbaB